MSVYLPSLLNLVQLLLQHAHVELPLLHCICGVLPDNGTYRSSQSMEHLSGKYLFTGPKCGCEKKNWWGNQFSGKLKSFRVKLFNIRKWTHTHAVYFSTWREKMKLVFYDLKQKNNSDFRWKLFHHKVQEYYLTIKEWLMYYVLLDE